jgi:thioesterase domain-containing protein
MAQQLARAGVVGSSLVLLHTPVPSGRLRRELFDPLATIAGFIRLQGLALDLEELCSLDAARGRARLSSLLEGAGWLPEGQGDRIISCLEATIEAHIDALERYRVQPYAGSMVLLLPRDGSDAALEDGAEEIRFDWSALCTRSFRAEVVPGTHATMLHPPNIAELARAFRRILEAGAGQPEHPAGPGAGEAAPFPALPVVATPSRPARRAG